MKRILFLTLALSILFTSLTSCGASLPSEPAVTEEAVESATEDVEEKRDPTGFAAGFARVEMNPKTSVGMAGYGNTEFRRSTIIEDDLTVSCTAVSDGENTALLFSLDVIGLSEQNCESIYRQIEKSLGFKSE